MYSNNSNFLKCNSFQQPCFISLLNDAISSASLVYKKEIQKCICHEIRNNIHDLQHLIYLMKRLCAPFLKEVIVNGPFDERIIVIILIDNSTIIISPNSKLSENLFIKKHNELIQIENLNSHTSYSVIPQSILKRLRSPNIKLIALYHPENFPLPRFALNISDIARSIREEYLGNVTMTDMQLNRSAEDIYIEIEKEKPDVIGISVTFGQYDVLENILNSINKIPNYKPLIVIGGSLAALNSKHLIETYNNIIISLSDGESSMPDIIKYWHMDLPIDQVNHIVTRKGQEIIQTSKIKPLSDSAGIPELDLLEETLLNRGVMQLESTRGCSYACSFCPRAHKGIWSPQSLSLFEKILPEISKIYTKYPTIAKKIFLVDEEFVGYRDDSATAARIYNVCNTLKKHNFTFETSARVDQVYRRTKDKSWHTERLKIWKYLVKNGLDRVLFGVESGVDSILKRFNKNTTKNQNEAAIRILSALNIPVRLTYITFDPLMTMDELIESYNFQGRKDLLLNPLPYLTEEEILEGIDDDHFIKTNSRQKSLYTEISYMLVSMECLIGSKYLKKVEEAYLAGEYNYLMGRRDASYLDPRIGIMSYNAQLWVDRNFALDYTIKSLEKIAPKEQRQPIRNLRYIVKDYAYILFGYLLSLMTKNLALISTEVKEGKKLLISSVRDFDHSLDDKKHNQKIIETLMDALFNRMIITFETEYDHIKTHLSQLDQEKMEIITQQWKTKQAWKLINAA